MARHYCITCNQPIPNGQAHIRSQAFTQVAYCASCWVMRKHTTAFRQAAS